jgi:hypothetical protein
MKPHDRADRAIDEAAADIAGALNKLMDKIYAMPDVAPDYAIERLLLHLERIPVDFTHSLHA